MVESRWKRALWTVAGALHRNIDARDVIGLLGLVLLGAGLALVWPPAALIAPGVVLIYVAIFGVKADGHSRED